MSEGVEDGERFFPADAGVRDADAVLKGGFAVALLVAGVDVAFDHHGADVFVTLSELAGDVLCHEVLLLPFFVAVAV